MARRPVFTLFLLPHLDAVCESIHTLSDPPTGIGLRPAAAVILIGGTAREYSQGRSATLARTVGGVAFRRPICPYDGSLAAPSKIFRIGIDSASLRPAGSFYSHLHTDRVRDSRNNGILHLQEVEPVLVELVSPEMRISVSMSRACTHSRSPLGCTPELRMVNKQVGGRPAGRARHQPSYCASARHRGAARGGSPR
jgi:hypothetical protein